MDSLHANLTATSEDFLMQTPEAPGVLLSVRAQADGDQLDLALGAPWARGFGADAVFRTASVTKPATALCALRLAEQGRLRLDDPAETYLPAPVRALLPRLQPSSETLTLRSLLQQTGGIHDFWTDSGWAEQLRNRRGERIDPMEFVRWSAENGSPVGEPGAVWHYTDTGYALVAFALEHVTGLALEDVYRALLPLAELPRTWLEGREPARADVSERAPMRTFGEDPWRWHPSYDTFGGGGLVSTAQDLALGAELVAMGKVVSSESLHRMTRSVRAYPGTVYGLGLWGLVDERGSARAWGHFGYHGAFAFWVPRACAAFGGSILMTDPRGHRPSLRYVLSVVEALERAYA